MSVHSWETQLSFLDASRSFLTTESMATVVHCVDYQGTGSGARADNEKRRLLVQTPFLCGGCMLFPSCLH